MKELEIVIYELCSESPKGTLGIVRVKVDRQSPFITLSKTKFNEFLKSYLDGGEYDSVRIINRTQNTITVFRGSSVEG